MIRNEPSALCGRIESIVTWCDEDDDASDQWNKIENAETNQSRSRARLDVWRRARAIALNTRPVEHSVVTTTVSDQDTRCIIACCFSSSLLSWSRTLSLPQRSRMHNLPLQLLLAALILVGGAHCCNYERMTNVPSYNTCPTPKKVLKVSRPHGICVADNGIFAVTFYARNGFFHLYYECGALMKVVRLPSGHGRMTDCAFSGSDLVYLIDRDEKKIYKYSTNGTLFKIIAAEAGHIIFITSCHNRLYATTESRRLVSYHNDKVVYRETVPGSPRGVVVDQNNELRDCSLLQQSPDLLSHGETTTRDNLQRSWIRLWTSNGLCW